MKNKYLNKFFCITMLSAMVLAIPTGVKAAEEADNVVAEEGVSGDGSEVSEPEPEVPAEPVPTAAPEPEITAAPDPEPTTAPEPTDTPTPAPTETPEPTATPAPTGTPEPTATPAPTATPEPTATPVPTATPARDDSAKVQAVIRKIKALAGRTITAADKAEINSVRAAYEALSNTEKAKVTNYKILTEAEAKLAAVDKNDSDNKKGNKKDNKKDDSSTEDNKNTEITDGNNATATQIGDPVYVTNMVSNLHAGKDFYLDSLKSNYHLSFSDDFASVMEEIEREYKEKNKLTDTENTLLVRNWQDILAVYIYEKSKAGATSFTLDASCKDDLARIFAEMNPIVRDKQDITKISYGNRKINYYIKKNNIAKKDRSVLKKYVETDCKLLCAVVTASKGFVRESVGDNVSEDRVDVITAAYSLVGKVGYFWGGKSTVIGEDPSWGSVEKVSADGSRSSGTLRAYGLDCSGFVTWAVINGYKDQGMQAAVGDGTSDQWEKAGVVSEADAQPGDLVFQRGPEAGSNNHVGILCGKTDSGDWIAVHCSSSKNGVTVGEAYSASFRYIRKPSFYQDTTAEENETTATENDVLTEESAEKLLTDVVRSDALASGDTVSSDLLADFKNKALQEDEEEDEVETLTLDQETMDDAVDTFDDDVETLEMEN
ncbi:hydrolase [Blautia massiliensis]|uniref:Hydrolase n=1 Tax=Blautia massiliensis (ex Durand et al. 2017) TaxID=1737424 RepID=A0A6L8T8N4_9FIRM|nr:NlpC/P60 family protein [Blautia massiliensis (ex Durand et al. 2017)]MZL60585.1 hydrolase [Blautia massiliensis (ex Durand et al. 2017)]